MNINYICYTDVGGRDNNEDSVLAVNVGESYLFVVADGLGGHECGEVASGILVRELEAQFRASPEKFDLEQAIKNGNNCILAEQARTGKKMKTTAAAVYINRQRTVVANVGDSRSYLFKNGAIVFQSFDHSVAQMAVQSGEIKASEIRSYPDKNILTRALGSAAELKVDIYNIENGFYDAVLIGSDGFWEYVLEDDMCRLLNQDGTLNDWLGRMREIKRMNAPANCDNNTAVAAFVAPGNTATQPVVPPVAPNVVPAAAPNVVPVAAPNASGTALASAMSNKMANVSAQTQTPNGSDNKKGILIGIIAVLVVLLTVVFVFGYSIGKKNRKSGTDDVKTTAAAATTEPSSDPGKTDSPVGTDPADKTKEPEMTPTNAPTDKPATEEPATPTDMLTEEPATPTDTPTDESATPSDVPTEEPATPTVAPTEESATPKTEPTEERVSPSVAPSEEKATPKAEPTDEPTVPKTEPTEGPSTQPSTSTNETNIEPIGGSETQPSTGSEDRPHRG